MCLRLPRLTVPAILLAFAGAGLAACDSGENETTGSGPAASNGRPVAAVVDRRPPEPDVSGVKCPAEIKISDRARCKLVARRVKLLPCPHSTTGYHVRVAGIACRKAYGFLSPLGGAGGVDFFKEAREKLTRPAVATYHRPFEIRGTGWTCWSAFMPNSSVGIQFVCWRGREVLTFRFG